ncbi:MAG: GNAT family N-acetyltransferase [Anaerolineae bacterium]|jgi:CelD/BcsL family acetyltransferase involved in cellulose biosynthesis
MSIPVELHRDPAVFDSLRDEWLALLNRSASDTIFLTPAYQGAWWRSLGEGDLLVLTARERGDLVGVAPLFAAERPDQGRVLQTVGCVEVSDYLDWIAAPGREEEVLRTLVDFLSGPEAPPWEVIDLCNIHRDSPTLRLLPDLASEHGWAVRTEVQEVCPVVNLPGTWDEYLASLSGKDRHELRRKLRRAEATGELRWYVVGPEHDLDVEMKHFLQLMAKSAPDKAEFLTPSMQGFFRELARVTFDAGWLQLSFLEWRGEKLASYLNFVYDNRILVYNSGLDWEIYRKLGAGVVLTGYLIELAIKEGREEYDFLRGGEAYKYSFGGKDVTVHRLVASREG